MGLSDQGWPFAPISAAIRHMPAPNVRTRITRALSNDDGHDTTAKMAVAVVVLTTPPYAASLSGLIISSHLAVGPGLTYAFWRKR